MDPLSILKLVLGSYRGAFLVTLFAAIWFDLLKVSQQTTLVGGFAITIGRTQVLAVVGTGLSLTLIDTLVRFLRRADFSTLVDAGFGTPATMTWSFEKVALADHVHRVETCADWIATNTTFNVKAAKRSITKLDDLLAAAHLPRYFLEPSGLNDNIAETRTTILLRTSRAKEVGGRHARVEGFGYITNERTHPGNSCLLLRIVADAAPNTVSLKPRFARRRIVTFMCREHYQPFQPGAHFRIFVSLECRFSLRRMRWFVESGVMSLETAEDVWRRVAIGFSNDHF